MQERPRVLDAHGGWVAARARRAQLGDEPEDPAVERGRAEPVEERRPVERVLAQFRVELVDRVGGVGAVGRDRALDARAVAVPGLLLPVPRAHEEHVALLGVGGVEDRHRVGLAEAGEEEEVGALAELVVDVAVADDFLRARHHRERVAERRGEAEPALEKGSLVRRCRHRDA